MKKTVSICAKFWLFISVALTYVKDLCALSKNPHRGIFASFDSSLPGYIAKDDTALIIENICNGKEI